MKKLFAVALAFLCLPNTAGHADIIHSFGIGTDQFTMTFVPIGSPGNASDQQSTPALAGSVGYDYQIGKYEISREMINKANNDGMLGITLDDMTIFGGNGPNRPATGVSWYEAARFVNWLNHSQGYLPAYKFAIQPGQPGYDSNTSILFWQPGDIGYDPNNQTRNSQAKFFIPNVDEWYKAAYYDPNANGGTGGYWDYATGSDSAPTSVSGGTAAGTAVYNQPGSQGPADVQNAGGLSPFGAMGLGGNVWEWMETEWNQFNFDPEATRSIRGGKWSDGLGELNAAGRWVDGLPWFGSSVVGFRVASNIPEPSSVALLMLASIGLWSRNKRRRSS